MPQNQPPLCEIINYSQVQQVVHAFYNKLIHHDELAHFFKHIDDFDSHEKRVSDFWWLALGGKLDKTPKIDMIGKHFPLGIQQENLETWLAIFSETLGEELNEEAAIIWMDKALQIGARIKQIVIDHKPMGIPIKMP
jgi:hemoglobin